METARIDDFSNPKVFAYWQNLASTNPERFEEERKAIIEKVILSGSPQNHEHIRALQWRIDAERAKAKNVFDSMLRLQKLMWEKFYAERGFQRAVNFQIEVNPPCSKDAEILPFKKD